MSQLLQQWLSTLGLAPKPAAQRIFISYRRRDSSGYAGRVADRLVKEFGEQQCFRDVEDIESGTDFVQAIEQAVGACDALIVVIGPDWLHIRDAAGHRRLDDPRDFVRLEIEAALQREVRVFPVLVGGANMPSAEELPPTINRLAHRQATEISDSRWDYDVGRLVTTLETMGIPRAHVHSNQRAPNYRKRIVMAAIGIVLVITGAIFGAAMVASSLQQQPNNTAGTVPVYPSADPSNVKTQDLAGVNTGNVKGSAPARDPAPSPPAYRPERSSSDAEDRQNILQILADGDQVSAEALRTHNATQLPQYFVGTALAEQITAVQLLVGAGAHVHATMHNRNIRGLRIAGDQAVVEQTLEYEIEFRNPQEQCMQRVPRHSSDQVITLVRQSGRWLVAHENTLTEAEPQPCY